MHRLADWLFLLLGVACFAALGAHFYRSRSAGRVLLDIRGRNSSRLAFGILALAAGLFWIFVPRFRFQGVCWIGYGALVIVASLGRFQIRESGILARRLFQWEDIQEYYLSPKGGLSLNLRDKGWTGVGKLAQEDCQRLNELLSARLPAQHVIDGF